MDYYKLYKKYKQKYMYLKRAGANRDPDSVADFPGITQHDINDYISNYINQNNTNYSIDQLRTYLNLLHRLSTEQQGDNQNRRMFNNIFTYANDYIQKDEAQDRDKRKKKQYSLTPEEEDAFNNIQQDKTYTDFLNSIPPPDTTPSTNRSKLDPIPTLIVLVAIKILLWKQSSQNKNKPNKNI